MISKFSLFVCIVSILLSSCATCTSYDLDEGASTKYTLKFRKGSPGLGLGEKRKVTWDLYKEKLIKTTSYYNWQGEYSFSGTSTSVTYYY